MCTECTSYTNCGLLFLLDALILITNAVIELSWLHPFPVIVLIVFLDVCYRAEYEATRKPYQDEMQLCEMLVAYLQRFVCDCEQTSAKTTEQTSGL